MYLGNLHISGNASLMEKMKACAFHVSSSVIAFLGMETLRGERLIRYGFFGVFAVQVTQVGKRSEVAFQT